MSVSKDSFGVDSVARRGGEATVVACGARAGGSLRLDAVSDDMEAGVPCSVVEVRAQIIRQHFKQFFNKHVEVFCGDIGVISVLSLEMTQLRSECVWIVHQRDTAIKTSQNSLRVSLEVRGVRVVTVNSREQRSGLWVVVEHLVPDFETEDDTLMSVAVRLVPLVLDL